MFKQAFNYLNRKEQLSGSSRTSGRGEEWDNGRVGRTLPGVLRWKGARHHGRRRGEEGLLGAGASQTWTRTATAMPQGDDCPPAGDVPGVRTRRPRLLPDSTWQTRDISTCSRECGGPAKYRVKERRLMRLRHAEYTDCWIDHGNTNTSYIKHLVFLF